MAVFFEPQFAGGVNAQSAQQQKGLEQLRNVWRRHAGSCTVFGTQSPSAFRFHHFNVHHADAQLTRRMAENIAFVGLLRRRGHNHQGIAA